MNIWKLEWLRLLRTQRWLAILSVFLFLGLASPVVAYYLPRLLPNIASTVRVQLPPSKPLDGFAYYTTDAMDLGVLVTVIVAAATFTFDAHRGIAIFYRTRMQFVGNLVIPKYVITYVSTVVSYLIGLAACWGVSALLLGQTNVIRVLPGILLEVIYLAFTIAVVALLAGWTRRTLPTIGFSFAILLILPLLGVFQQISMWLPSNLIGSLAEVLHGNAFDIYGPSAGITVCSALILLFLSIFFFERPTAR